MNSPDAELLERYVGENSDDAFAELVRRHFDLVYSAAARQLAGDRDLARDVAQTVFADLARKARSLSKRSSITGWLYTSTHFAAAKFVRTERRRREREQAAVAVQCANSESGLADCDLQPIVDCAFIQLSERDRDALLLRYVEQRELRIVGAALGISEEAARKRVERALEKLRAILSRDGLSATSASVAAGLTRSFTAPAPVGLAARLAELARSGGPLTSTTPAFLPAIIMTKTKLVAFSALALAGVITPILLQQRLIERLRLENGRIQEAALAERGASASAAVNPTESDAELKRLRLEHSELLRLRGDVAQLRRDLAETSAKRPGQTSPPVPDAEPDRSAEPVQTFIANAEALIPSGSGLVFGGWPTSPGKRMLVFVQPKVVEVSSPGRVGSILLEGKFVEVPDEALASLGLEKLRTNARATSIHSLLTSDELRSTLEMLEKMTGASVLSAPRIQSGDGVQGVMSVTQNKTIGGQEHALGPKLDIEPSIAPDGTSVILTVSARFKKTTASE